MLEPLFYKVAGPEACFPANFAKVLRMRFLQKSPYSFVSNSNGTSLFKENYLDFTNLANS